MSTAISPLRTRAQPRFAATLNSVSFAEPDDPARETLVEVMTQFLTEIGADGSLLTLRDAADPQPQLLFAGGVCAGDPDFDGTLPLLSPRPTFPFRRQADASSIDWRSITTDSGEWTMLTLPLPGSDGGGTLSVSALFATMSMRARTAAENAVARMRPLLTGFFRLWMLRAASESRIGGLTCALDQSDVGILVLDRDAALLFANRTARGLLDNADGLRRKGRSLAATELSDSLRLQVAISHVLDAPERPTGRARRTPVVALRRTGKLRPLMVSVLAPDQPPAGSRDAAAILYVFNPDQDVLPLLQPACHLYGLSPVETRLACLLSGGASLGEAAVEMRIKEQTARTYLKQVFQKTGTNRQADLVRVMLSSVVRTARGAEIEIV